MFIRVFLLSGLVLHKVIWEIWKRKYRFENQTSRAGNSAKTLVKIGKISFLIFLFLQALFLNVLPIEDPPWFIRYLGLALFVTGLSVSISARICLGGNWSDLEDRQILPQQRLVTEGVYRYIRHPIYIGDLLLVTGFELALTSWLFVLGFLIAAVVVRQAIAEEKLLARSFPEYNEYCMRTKRFLPFLV